MDKSTYRVLVVLILAVLAVFVVMGYFKFTASAGYQSATHDVDAEEMKKTLGELQQNNAPIGFKYKAENPSAENS